MKRTNTARILVAAFIALLCVAAARASEVTVELPNQDLQTITLPAEPSITDAALVTVVLSYDSHYTLAPTPGDDSTYYAYLEQWSFTFAQLGFTDAHAFGLNVWYPIVLPAGGPTVTGVMRHSTTVTLEITSKPFLDRLRQGTALLQLYGDLRPYHGSTNGQASHDVFSIVATIDVSPAPRRSSLLR